MIASKIKRNKGLNNYVFSILLYVNEYQTISSKIKRKLEVTEIPFYRRREILKETVRTPLTPMMMESI